jgi:hypothetical protein
MAGAIEAFFDGLAKRRHDPFLERISGTLCIELSRDGEVERWFVTVDHGDIDVDRVGRAADSVFRASAAVFEELVRGEVHGVGTILRGEAIVAGNVELAMRLQRLLPGRATSAQPTAHVASTPSRRSKVYALRQPRHSCQAAPSRASCPGGGRPPHQAGISSAATVGTAAPLAAGR